MALGRRKQERQDAFWVPVSELPRSEGHVFYSKLNQLLREAAFDAYVESLCEAYYHATMGRPGIPPGIYFRMLLVGYFEGLSSQRGIAWRCADSLSLREFLGVPLSENTPDHSSLTRTRDRLPLAVHTAVFQFVLRVADEQGLLKGKTVGVDATTLEADAAMKSIVRRDTGEDWQAYIQRLMREAGQLEEGQEASADQIARFDRQRKDKKVSNQEWQSTTDPDSRITKMKDGRTHLAYKAEHVVDLDTELIVAAEVYQADAADVDTIGPTISQAQDNLLSAESDAEIREAVADKGYSANETLAELEFTEGLRTYIVEPQHAHRRNWKNKPDEERRAVTNNRRRTRGQRGRALQRQRSEKVERSFAHVCETGGSRRTWLHGIEKVRKRYLISAMARNLGLIMRALFGFGTARSLQGEGELADALYFALFNALSALTRLLTPTRQFTQQESVADHPMTLAA
jgi:transposase